MLLAARGVAGTILPNLLVRVASSAAAVGIAGWAWSQLDCPPLLFLQDKWMHRSFFGLLGKPKQSSTLSLSTHHHHHHQTLWIVGASSGIGEEFAYQWIQQLPRRVDPSGDKSNIKSNETSHLILSARSTHKLQRVAANCRKLIESSSTTDPKISCKVHILPVDVTSYESLRQAVQDKFPLKHEEIDMVMLNAGQGHLSPAVETSPETCQRMLTVNALWPQWLVSLLWQQRQQQREQKQQSSSPSPSSSSSLLPRLLVISSVAGHIPVPLSAAYSASKFALVGYFRTLCCEEPTVQVTLFSPGPVATDFGKNRYNPQQQQQSQKHPHRCQNMKNNDDDKMKLDASVSSTGGDVAADGGGAAAALRNSNSNNKSLKMSVQRCVRLMLTAMYLHSNCMGYREVWISTQPALTILYLQRWFPGLTQYLLAKHVGPKRVHLWRQGLDLYDPQNWRNN